MIFTDRTIMVKNGTSSINDTIVLYRGDREVEIRFSLNEGSPFKFGSGSSPNIIEKTEATYGQLVIKTPGNLPPIFSEVAPTIGGKIIFTITAEMIDEITEIGNYTFQIRLLDDSMESRATLPEVKNGIEIREPIALEDISSTNEVEVAAVGYALTTAGTQEGTFDAEGNYNKTTWTTGDRITASKLNKIEAGIDGVNQKVASGGTGEGLTDNSVKFQHLNEALRNRLFEYRDINCNKLSWTKQYVDSTLTIKYSNNCLLSECLNVEPGEKLLAENGHEFKIVYYEGDTISSLSKRYVTSFDFTQPAKIRIQASRQDSATMDLDDFLSKQNIIYSKFAISTDDNSSDNSPNNLNKIHIITNTIKDNYKPLGSDYIAFVDGTNKLDSLYSLWDNLMSEHSDYITKEVIGQDSTGLNINVYKLTPPSKRMSMNDDNFTMLKIIYISCLHGDEPNAPYADFRFFKHLATGHASNDTLKMLYDNVEFVVCPIANPWGYNNNSRLNSNGVNLNRNFPANWVAIEQGKDYSGATAASEIETQLIMKLIDDNSDAFFMFNRHGTATFTEFGRFGYTSSNFKSDRKISYDLFRRLDSSLKDSFKFINSDEPANITRNILGVSFSDAVGNLENYANITKNMNGVLLELGARRFGDSYPTGTLQDMQAMEVEVIGALLETVVLNNSFLLSNK